MSISSPLLSYAKDFVKQEMLIDFNFPVISWNIAKKGKTVDFLESLVEVYFILKRVGFVKEIRYGHPVALSVFVLLYFFLIQ